MELDELIIRVEEIRGLVMERRFEIAFALIDKLEAAIADDKSVTRPVRELVATTRLMTETLIQLQRLQVH